MDTYIKAFEMGQEQAIKHNLSKEASAADVAKILGMLGSAGSSAAKSTGKGLEALAKGTGKLSKGTKYLGVSADPRSAMLVGGAGLTAGLVPAIMSAAKGEFGEAALKAGGTGLAALGAGLAMGANPGLLGGSIPNRVTHELAMNARTPSGLIGTMAAVVGLPAALIAYGKMKGKEEASIF